MIYTIRNININRLPKRILLLLFLIISFSSCRFFEKGEPVNERNITDLVIIGVDQKIDFSDSIPNIDISGKWILNTIWAKKDSTWKGFKSLNISQYYIFRENGVFHHYETYNDTLINSYLRGDYLFKPDERILILLVNEKGDTLFQHGDTCKARDLFIYSLNDSIFRLEECVLGDCSNEQFIEFQRFLED